MASALRESLVRWARFPDRVSFADLMEGIEKRKRKDRKKKDRIK